MPGLTLNSYLKQPLQCYYLIMEYDARKLELEQADLLGYNPDTLRCNQCGGAFCGLRVGRVLEGKPLIMCSRKDEVKKVLSSISRR